MVIYHQSVVNHKLIKITCWDCSQQVIDTLAEDRLGRVTQSNATTQNVEGGCMPRSIFNVYCSANVRDTEISHLRSAYNEALKQGDLAQCAIIAKNLQYLENLAA